MHELAIAAARDRRLRGEQADAPVARELHGGARLGGEHADHRHLQRLLQVAEGGRRGRVAGDHDELDALAHEPAGDLLRERAQLGRRTTPVREVRGVAGVEEVLVRHRHEALVQDREPSHARVEHTDWTLGFHALMVVGAFRSGRTRRYAARVRLLCIHHEPTSDGGTLLAPARAGGWAIEHWHAHAGEPRPLLEGVDAVVAYGGTMNPDDDARLAWLADVRATLAEAVERDTAVLGICLGAQLLGQALGAARPGWRSPSSAGSRSS